MKKTLLFLFLLFLGMEGFAQADMVLTNTNYQTAFIPGYASVYTVTVTNNGPNDAANVLVTNPIPAGITQFSWTGDNGSTGTNVPLSDLIAIFNAGDTVTYTITLFVPPAFVGTLNSSATVVSPTTDPDNTNNSVIDTDIAPAPGSADIVVVKTDSDLTYTAGNTQTYTITLENHGPAAAVNVAISDLVPAGIIAANVTWVGDNSTSGTGNLADAIANMAVGDVITYTVTMPVPSDFDQDTDLVNTVTTTSGTADPNPLCPNCEDTDTPDPVADIDVTKDNGQTQYLVDEDTTYTITVTNNGPSDAVNVIVTDNMPSGITIMEWSGDNGSSGTGNMVDNIPALANGETVTYTVTLHVPVGYNTTVVNLSNLVTVTSDSSVPVVSLDVDTPRPRWVTVDITTYTVPQLIEDVLIDSDCANVSNFTSQIGAGANIGVGYFHRNNSNFQIKSGVVIRCGRAKACEGPFTDGSTSTVGSGSPDNNSIGYPSPDNQDLHGVSIANGNGGSINDVSYVQFNFLPLTDNFSFKFLFASNEYGTYQCTFGDVFAFILKDQVTGIITNLAVIPSTTIPVSVTSIRDASANGACGSVNAGFFDVYNVDFPANAAIDMRGQTIPMIASATVVPNHLYSIKLVIGDYQDDAFDSAVFIEAGSFNVGQANLGGDFLATAGSAVCDGETVTLETGLNPAGYTFTWLQDDIVMPGETSPTLVVTEAGVYEVIAANGTCEQRDKVTVEYLPPLPVNQPADITQCVNLFDLTQIESAMLGILNPANYDISYYHTQQNAIDAFMPIAFPTANPTTYTGTNGEVIWVRVDDTATSGCYIVKSFTLHIPNCGVATDPGDQAVCDDITNDGAAIFNLDALIPDILDTNAAADYTITFHLSLANANADAPGLIGTNAYMNTVNPQTIYVRMENNIDQTSYSTVAFDLIVHPQPLTPNPADVTVCDSYALPALGAGQTYHSAPGGAAATLITLPATITTTQTIWIYAQSGTTPNCSAEGDFLVTVNHTPLAPDPPDVVACDSYQLPALASPTQSYHAGTATGAVIAPLTLLTTNQTVVIVDETGTTPNCSSSGDFTVTINPTPLAPNPADVTVCDSYALPALGAGQTYHSAPGGAAATLITLPATITTTQTIWIYAQSGTTPNCSAEGDFLVTVNHTPLAPDPPDVVACDSYQLPALASPTQSYHAGTATGAVIAPLTLLTTNQTVVIVDETGTTPNCSSSGGFTVTINPTPLAPNPADVTVCDSYALPALGAGQTYHSAPGGAAATLITLPATITTTQTIWIYAQSGTTPNCSAEGDFLVTVNQTPVADDPADVVACDSYTLPALNVGNYFSGTGGSGTAYFAGDAITSSMTMYVYAQTGSTPNCTGQNDFQIGIFYSPSVSVPSDYHVCDDNNDGFSCLFVLGTRNTEVTSNAGLTVTYHETLTDAQNGANAINQATYCNIVTAHQTLHVRVFDPLAPLCYSLTTLELYVDPVPVPNPVISDYRLCDDTNPGDQAEGFDLPSKDLEILNGQTGLAVSYYLSQGDATTDTAPINTAILYDNISNPQQIWVRLTNPLTDCFAVSSFYLHVDPLPLVVGPVVINECGSATGVAQFDLTAHDLDISDGVPGTEVHYYLTLADAQDGTNPLASPYTNISNPQVIVAAVKELTHNCISTTTVTLTVSQGPAIGTPTALQVCDPNNDGYAQFDLTDTYIDVVGSNPPPAGITVTFHETLTDAQNGQTPVSTSYFNINPTDQVIYIRVAYDATGCYSIVPLSLHVNDTPQATEIDPLPVCDDDTDGIGTFNLTLATPLIMGGYDPGQHTLTYHLSLGDAATGTAPITNLLGFHNTTPGAQTIWVRLEDNLTGCFDVIELGLIVNPKPTLPPTPTGAVSPFTKCDINNPGDGQEEFDLSEKLLEILNGQTGVSVSFYVSLADAQVPQNALPDLYTNGPNAQTLHVRLQNDLTGCYVLTTMDLRVEPLPVLIPPARPIAVCDPDGDGFALFDLTALVPAMVQGAPNITVTFHETPENAQDGIAAISINPYPNIDPFLQLLYVRAVNTVTGCVSVMTIELNAIASPVVPVLEDQVKCDEDANNNGYTVFDLTTQEGDILAAQAGPASNYTITYHLTQAQAQAGTGLIFPATGYTNLTNPQTIWVRVEDNSGSTCFNVGSFDLRVNVPLVLTTPSQLTICDDGPTSAVPQAVFDLTVRNNEITGNAAGYIVTYYQSQADALAGTNPITTPSAYTNNPNPQTLFVAVTGPTPLTCRSYTTLTIRVLPLPVPQTQDIPPLEVCDDNSPVGTDLFDLTLNEDYIRDNDPGLIFGYYASEADAQAQTNPIVPATAYESASGFVWIRVMRSTEANYLGEFCYVIVRQELILHPLPVVPATPTPLVACDPAASGTYLFTLSQANGDVIAADPSQDVADFTFTYYLNLADAQAQANPLGDEYTNITNPQDIVVDVVNIATGCHNYAVVTLSVRAGATATGVTAAAVCDDGGLDGQTAIDLTQFDTQVLAGQDPLLFTVAYFASQAGALDNTGALASPYYTGTGQIYAVVTNTTTTCRSDFATVDITVEPLVDVVVSSANGSNTLCVEWGTDNIMQDLVLSSNLSGDAATYDFQWLLNGTAIPGATDATYSVPLNAEGDYTLQATTALGCVSTSAVAFTAVQSGQAQLVSVSVSGAFEDSQAITVVVEGHGAGHYQYQLDDGPILDNGGVFTDVAPGLHTVRVYDMKGNGISPCEFLLIENIHSIDYPHYFTPNGDGVHDTWKIEGLDDSAKIYIFDRYGKLVKQIAPNGEGWDGTYNGQPLPSTDYWFTVYYNEPNATTTISKEFKAHFSLKR